MRQVFPASGSCEAPALEGGSGDSAGRTRRPAAAGVGVALQEHFGALACGSGYVQGLGVRFRGCPWGGLARHASVEGAWPGSCRCTLALARGLGALTGMDLVPVQMYWQVSGA